MLGVGERGGGVVLDWAALARMASPAFARMREQAPAELSGVGGSEKST